MTLPFSGQIYICDVEPLGYDTRAFQQYGTPAMTYEEIFESDGRWLLGKSILSDVVSFVRGKPLVAVRDREDLSRLNIEIPLPTVRDEITNELVSIAYMVPPELQEVFIGQLTEAMNDYLGEGGMKSLERFLNAPMTNHTVSKVQAELSEIERHREASDEGQLWKVVAHYLGMPTIVTHSKPTFAYSTR